MYKTIPTFLKRAFTNKKNRKTIMLSIPLVFAINSFEKFQCWSLPEWLKWSPSFKPNKISNRINSMVYPSNNPTEDKILCMQLTSIDGYLTAIFDGHGGWQLAEYLERNFGKQFNQALAQNKSNYSDQLELITASVKKVIKNIENKFLDVARKQRMMGSTDASKIGSCFLAVVVSGDNVYTINMGDSQAAIVSEEKNEQQSESNIYTEMLNLKQNINSEEQKNRLKAQFPEEKDIVFCKKKKNCYVKGLLQPTNTIGDFSLKYDDLKHSSITNPIRQPYIRSTPEIRQTKLQTKHKYIIMGSDGLWNQLPPEMVRFAILNCRQEAKDLAEEIFDLAMHKVSTQVGMQDEQLKKIPVGARIKVHDDISIIVINLENQK